jgi:hypothetical protein
VMTDACDLEGVDWVIHAVGPEYQQWYLHKDKVGHIGLQ